MHWTPSTRCTADLRESICALGFEALPPEFADSIEQFVQACRIEQRLRCGPRCGTRRK
jgi:hypothetical protein